MLLLICGERGVEQQGQLSPSASPVRLSSALLTIAHDLNVSPGAAQYTLAVFMIGAALGLYVLTGACMVGTLLAYITGAAFIYIETLGVTPGLFAVLFGINAMGFVGASQLNRLLLRCLSMVSVIRGAVMAAVLIGMGLLVVASGQASTRTLTVLFIAQAATVGATLPNVTALALGSVREWMGSAAALQGTAQSVVAGVAGWLVGTLGNGAALPMMGIITGFATLAAVFLRAAHRRQPEEEGNMLAPLLDQNGS